MKNFNIETLEGNCPVQATGDIDGLRFYFRARGSSWSFSVAENDAEACGPDPVYVYSEKYSDDPYAAGWINTDEANMFILEAASKYFLWKITNV